MNREVDNFSVANLGWEGDIPASKEYDDVYFSLVDGLKESQYVFIEANQLASRLIGESLALKPFIVAEAGFGTGLNFLLSWRQWLACEEKGRRDFHYISFEKHPLSLFCLVLSLLLMPFLSPMYSYMLNKNMYNLHLNQ